MGLEEIVGQLDRLTLKTKAVSSAVQNTWEDRTVIAEKVRRLEQTQHNKMIVISGLTLTGKKYEKMRQLENFFETELGINPFIEDFYETGVKQPTLKVVTLQSLRDKQMVMRHKSYLKGVVNEFKSPIYINDYLPQEAFEKRKRHKEIYRVNQQSKEDKKLDMELERGELYVNGNPYVNPLAPPNPQDILDLTTGQLAEVMNLELSGGPEISNEGNVFQAYSLCTNSLKEVQEAYLKMKLTHPKARHIMCAYYIEDENPLLSRGCCDDGEYGASQRILDFLVEHSFICKAIYFVRYYSGKKIGPDRFMCIL